MSRSGFEFFQHIKDELNFLETNSKGLDYNSFVENEVLKRAFSRSLEIIGEAVKDAFVRFFFAMLQPGEKSRCKEVGL